MILPLKGKTAIITGASQGLGLEISHKYIKAGASLLMCARNINLLQKAQAKLTDNLIPGQVIEVASIDVSNVGNVEELANFAIQRFEKIDILVNNAGIYGPMGSIETIDWVEWVKAIEINLFGSILMCKAVLPIMKKQNKGKIIQLSGGGATKPMPNISAYAVSKAAIVRFAETLAEELREFNIDVNSIAPGSLNTRMLDEVITAGPEKVGQDFFDKSLQQKKTGGDSMNFCADLALFLATDASNGITAKLISALWDQWDNWPEHLEELDSTDIYTLRRIAGRDRGFSWGDK